MSFDRKFLACALGYMIVGICMGMYMGGSHDLSMRDAHSHILFIGFLFSLSYATIHKLWIERPPEVLAEAQFLLHQGGAAFECAGLVVLYGELAPAEWIEPVLGLAALAVLLGALLMLYMIVRKDVKATEPIVIT